MKDSFGFKIVIRIVLTFLSFSVLAQEKTSQDVDGLVDAYQSQKKKMSNIELDQRRVMGNIYQITNKIKNVAQKRDRLLDRSLSINGSIRVLARDIAALEEKIKRSRYSLSKRLRTIYVQGGRSVLHIVFSSSSAIELDRNIKYLNLVSQRDYELIKQYQQSLSELEFQRSRLKIKVKSLLTIQGHLKKQENLLEETQREKSMILSELQKKKQQTIGKLKGIRRKGLLSKDLGKTLKEALTIPIFENKGKLAHPVDAMIGEKFGLTINKKYQYILGHKGLFYNAEFNSPVKSVYGGKVVFVGALPGYHKTIIVDHGDHYYSLYTQLNKTLVNVGNEIQAEQVIARVGQGIRYESPGLYFEMRHFSEAIDPEHWLKSEVQFQKASR